MLKKPEPTRKRKRSELKMVIARIEEIINKIRSETSNPKLKVLDITSKDGTLDLELGYLNKDIDITVTDPNIRNMGLVQNIVNVTPVDFLNMQLDTFPQQDIVVYSPDAYEGKDTFENRVNLTMRLLRSGGRLVIISRKKFGAEYQEKYLIDKFGQENLKEPSKIRGGYRLFTVNKPAGFVDTLEPQPRNLIKFVVNGVPVELQTENSLFSPGEIDKGTRTLLETVATDRLLHFRRMLDIGCGQGVIGITAALTNPQGEVVMTDVDARAIVVTRDNINLQNLKNAQAIYTDNINRDVEGKFDLILSNPPFHADYYTLKHIFLNAKNKLAKGGNLYIVVESTYLNKFVDILTEVFGKVNKSINANNRYFVLNINF